MTYPGIFITFEGMDGSGKTTQMHRLAARLRALGRIVTETVEPGGPPVAQKIRRILLDSANPELSPTTEILLYFASRAQNVDEWITPALQRGEIVLSDRFTDSSLAYQGVGRGLGIDTVQALERIACRGLKPDLTILVDVDAEASLARARARNEAAPHCETRMDDQAIEFHLKVHAAYRALAAAEPERVQVVDGRAGMDEIERAIWSIVSAHVMAGPQGTFFLSETKPIATVKRQSSAYNFQLGAGADILGFITVDLRYSFGLNNTLGTQIQGLDLKSAVNATIGLKFR